MVHAVRRRQGGMVWLWLTLLIDELMVDLTHNLSEMGEEGAKRERGRGSQATVACIGTQAEWLVCCTWGGGEGVPLAWQ